jgi:Cohesin domain/Dockerin type I domain
VIEVGVTMIKRTFLRLFHPLIGARLIVVALFALMMLGMSTTTVAQTSGSIAGQKCPDSVHDSYTVVGPDGNIYPTWHPPADPTYGCWFDHEHGSDPHKFVGFAAIGMPPFGYTSTTAGKSEPHEGFKVYVANDDRIGHAWMIVLHQGTRGPGRAFTQFHSLDWYITTTSGDKLVAVHTMTDFGYASPNCSGPGKEFADSSVALPNSGGAYPFHSYQSQRRYVPTVDCASTRPYESWNGVTNVANVFTADTLFDVDNPSTVIDPNNPTSIRYMCEFRSPNENCASFYGTQWSGNKRGVKAFEKVNNSGPVEFYTDPYGSPTTAGTPGAIKQYVTNQSFKYSYCACAYDVFRLRSNSGGIYITPDGGAGLDQFLFGPPALGHQPPPVQPPPVEPPPVEPPPVEPPPVEPPPVPTTPAVMVSVNPTDANVGDNVEVDISVANVAGLYGLQTECTVDPAILAGVSHADGGIFNSSNSFFVDSGFSAGQWTVAASLLQPAPAFKGADIAYKLNYTVQGAGSSSVTCTALAVDANGKDLPVQVVNASFNGAPVVEPPPVEPPPVEPPPVEPPPVEPPPAQLSTISGVVTYQNHPDKSGITVQLVTSDTVLATVTTTADGQFSFTDVQVGSYGITAIAPLHLRIGKVVEVTADGQSIHTGTLTLPAGDTDNNGAIDLTDAGLIGANFNNTVPPSPSNADLNLDGKVDIHDLALLGGNFGLTGPVVVQ